MAAPTPVARIIAAADAERRRLERDLHDGAQQRLVSLALALRAVEAQLPDDPAAARHQLAGARQELAPRSTSCATLREGSTRPSCGTAAWARRWTPWRRGRP
jgi:Histidine kinase